MDIKQLCYLSTHPKDGWEYDKDITSTEMSIFEVDGIQIIAYRGSTDGIDWFNNIGLSFPWFFEGRLHHLGFSMGMREMNRIVKKNVDFSKKTVFIGHSNGAARASIGYKNLRKRFTREVACIVFAQPRDEFFLTEIFHKDGDILRITVDGDVVPHVPCTWMGYRHSGAEIRLPKPKDKKGIIDLHMPDTYEECVGKYAQDMNCSDSAMAKRIDDMLKS
jgi:hypothetical protein